MRKKPETLPMPTLELRRVPFGILPPTARVLYGALRTIFPTPLHFEIRGRLPVNSNNQLRQGRLLRGRGRVLYLRPEVEEFRTAVLEALAGKGASWRPRGVTCAIIVLESPLWTTEKRTPRMMDVDNRYKALGDAIELTTRVADQTTWELHLYKLASTRTRTMGILFDLGNEIDFATPEGDEVKTRRKR